MSFDPSEARDEFGKWTAGGAAAVTQAVGSAHRKIAAGLKDESSTIHKTFNSAVGGAVEGAVIGGAAALATSGIGGVAAAALVGAIRSGAITGAVGLASHLVLGGHSGTHDPAVSTGHPMTDVVLGKVK